MKRSLITLLCHFKRIQKITLKNKNQRAHQCVTKGKKKKYSESIASYSKIKEIT